MGEPEIPEDSTIGPDPDVYVNAIQSRQADGYDHGFLHQVGPDRQGFLEFYKNSLVPLYGVGKYHHRLRLIGKVPIVRLVIELYNTYHANQANELKKFKPKLMDVR